MDAAAVTYQFRSSLPLFRTVDADYRSTKKSIHARKNNRDLFYFVLYIVHDFTAIRSERRSPFYDNYTLPRYTVRACEWIRYTYIQPDRTGFVRADVINYFVDTLRSNLTADQDCSTHILRNALFESLELRGTYDLYLTITVDIHRVFCVRALWVRARTQ